MITWSDTATGAGEQSLTPQALPSSGNAHCSLFLKHTCTPHPHQRGLVTHPQWNESLSYYLFPLYLSCWAYKAWIGLWDRNQELNISTFIKLVRCWEDACMRTCTQSSHNWQRQERGSMKTKWLLQRRTDETRWVWREDGWRGGGRGGETEWKGNEIRYPYVRRQLVRSRQAAQDCHRSLESIWAHPQQPPNHKYYLQDVKILLLLCELWHHREQGKSSVLQDNVKKCHSTFFFSHITLSQGHVSSE